MALSFSFLFFFRIFFISDYLFLVYNGFLLSSFVTICLPISIHLLSLPVSLSLPLPPSLSFSIYLSLSLCSSIYLFFPLCLCVFLYPPPPFFSARCFAHYLIKNVALQIVTIPLNYSFHTLEQPKITKHCLKRVGRLL